MVLFEGKEEEAHPDTGEAGPGPRRNVVSLKVRYWKEACSVERSVAEVVVGSPHCRCHYACRRCSYCPSPGISYAALKLPTGLHAAV